MNPNFSPEKHTSPENINGKRESKNELLARITFSRHEETNYTGVGRDITDRGIARAQEKGRTIAREKGIPSVIGHSPRTRAIGTAESIAEGVQDETVDRTGTRWINVPGLRSSDIHNKDAHAELAKEFGASQEAWTDAHYNRPDFYDNPESFETNEEKRSRMYRELERLISFIEKRPSKGEVPHLVFVSHYELLTLLLDDVFGIHTFGTTNTPTFGEHIDIEIYEPQENGSVPILIHYNDQEKRVLFDRGLRRLVSEKI